MTNVLKSAVKHEVLHFMAMKGVRRFKNKVFFVQSLNKIYSSNV